MIPSPLHDHHYRMQALDLAGHSADTKVTSLFFHVALEEYGKVIPGHGFENRKFKEHHSNPLSCEDAVKLINKNIFFEKFSGIEYNCHPTLCNFIKHAEGHKEMGASAAFRTFKPDTTNELELLGGSTCSGYARTLIETLGKEPYNLKAYPIIEKMSKTAPANHASTLIPCTDGVILIDLAPRRFLILKPQTVTNSYETMKEGIIKSSFQIIETQEDYDIKNIVITKKQSIKSGNKIIDFGQSEYLFRSINNPDNPVMTRYILAMNLYVHDAKAKNGDDIKIMIDYDPPDHSEGEVILYKKAPHATSSRKVALPFHLFDSNSQTIDEIQDPVKKAQFETFLGGDSIDDFWNEFKNPKETKNQLFFLTRKESLSIMKQLFEEIK